MEYLHICATAVYFGFRSIQNKYWDFLKIAVTSILADSPFLKFLERCLSCDSIPPEQCFLSYEIMAYLVQAVHAGEVFYGVSESVYNTGCTTAWYKIFTLRLFPVSLSELRFYCIGIGRIEE